MGGIIRLLAVISAETFLGEKEVAVYIQNAKRNIQVESSIWHVSIHSWSRDKNFPDKKKLKMFITTKLALQEMLRGLLRVENNKKNAIKRNLKVYEKISSVYTNI